MILKGDWCAFSGGGGSGGCIITGPYEPMIVAKDDLSDESFESTEESDANIDLNGPVGITKNNFQNMEVVWAKRPALPWFPGIVCNILYICCFYSNHFKYFFRYSNQNL